MLFLFLEFSKTRPYDNTRLPISICIINENIIKIFDALILYRMLCLKVYKPLKWLLGLFKVSNCICYLFRILCIEHRIMLCICNFADIQ